MIHGGYNSPLPTWLRLRDIEIFRKKIIQFCIFKRYYRCDIQGAESGLLAGKTVAIKDNVCVAGVPMMNGSKLLEGFVPDRDATIVTRILDAGIE